MVSEKQDEVRNSQKDKKQVEILSKPFGDGYQTNCYICVFPQGEIVIDPGMGATSWVVESCKNPLAFLNTHGHFDHIWSNYELKQKFSDVPLICPELDSFMLESDCFSLGLTPSNADIKIPCKKSSHSIEISGISIIFHHFPGHTPGCSIIELGGHIFSGDFIFHRSIGRSDFPYSSNSDMLDSLQRFESMSGLDSNTIIHPGHGKSTILCEEQQHVHLWIKHLSTMI